jgi:hypothetical protein
MRARSLLPVLPVLGLVLAMAVVTPAAEAAAVRYAKPSGSGTACTAAVPCTLAEAVNNASTGDEVVLAPGTYTPGVQIKPTNDSVHIHATSGQPRPVVSVSSAGTAVALSSSSSISDVEIDQTGTGSALSMFGFDNTATRVIARATSGVGCYGGFGALMQDALCVASAGGTAFNLNFAGTVVSTMKVRNLTAIATGSGSTAFEIYSYGSGSHMTMDVKNSILSGAVDVKTSAGGGAQTTVTLATSNYDNVDTAAGGTVTPAGTATNQTAAPVFADTTLYHEAGTSPTVDAGAADADAGTTDLDGDARQLGKGVDIGADELVPPPTPPDTTAPDTAFGKKPGKRTHSRKAKFTFTATEAATFLCSLDKKPATPCASPFKKRVKKVGKHTFTVVAVDAAGNLDPTPADYTWHVKAKPRRTNR